MDTQPQSNEITLCAPAKLNLFLHINRRRSADETFAGYHELQTVFQILDFGDELTFAANDQGKVELKPAIEGVPLEENLIYKAAIALKNHAKENQPKNQHQKIETLGATIELKKVLPMGGGLGGGSTNAASTLLALNKIWKLGFCNDDLMEIGTNIGADVPVFVLGLTAIANGIGEELSPLALPEQWYVVLRPECHISTAKIFSHERLTRDTPKKRIAPALEGQSSELLEEFLSDQYRNDFEKLVCELYPQVQECIQWLNQHGKARMTGTGACCFCSVDSKEAAEKVLNEARSKFKGFIAKGVQVSPAIQRLNEA